MLLFDDEVVEVLLVPKVYNTIMHMCSLMVIALKLHDAQDTLSPSLLVNAWSSEQASQGWLKIC